MQKHNRNPPTSPASSLRGTGAVTSTGEPEARAPSWSRGLPAAATATARVGRASALGRTIASRAARSPAAALASVACGAAAAAPRARPRPYLAKQPSQWLPRSLTVSTEA